MLSVSHHKPDILKKKLSCEQQQNLSTQVQLCPQVLALEAQNTHPSPRNNSPRNPTRPLSTEEQKNCSDLLLLEVSISLPSSDCCSKRYFYPCLTPEQHWGPQCLQKERVLVCVPAVVQADWTKSWQPGPMVHIQTKVQLRARSPCPLKYFPALLCAKKMSEQTEKGKQRRHWLQKSISDILNVLSDIVHHSQMLEI